MIHHWEGGSIEMDDGRLRSIGVGVWVFEWWELREGEESHRDAGNRVFVEGRDKRFT